MSKIFDNKSAKKIIKSTRKLPKYARKISKQHKQNIINKLLSNDANEIPIDIKADHVINNKSNNINLYNLDDKENITYECENDIIIDKKLDIDEFDKCLDCICADIENIDYPDIN